MKKRVLLTVLACALASLACATILGASTSSGTQPNPNKLIPIADESRMVEAVIPPEGGTLTATGADGTRYTLDIPADALFVESNIRMTPLKSLSGLPLKDGKSLAVRLEPDGLSFFKFATLTIIPAKEIPINEQIFFSYQGDGDGFQLAPPVVSSRDMKIIIFHFTGDGVATGSQAEQQTLLQRLVGPDIESRVNSEIARKTAINRQKQLLGDNQIDPKDAIVYEDMFKELKVKVVDPKVAASGQSCAAGLLAEQAVTGLQHQRQILGMKDDPEYSGAAVLTGFMKEVRSNCLKEEYQLCRDKHIIHRIVPFWLSQQGLLQKLGLEDAEFEKEAKIYVGKCLHFDLEFESSVTSVSSESGGEFDSHVKSKVPLTYDTEYGTEKKPLSGKRALENDLFIARLKSREGCNIVSHKYGSDFNVIDLFWTVGNHGAGDKVGFVKDILLTHLPGKTQESFTMTCPNDFTLNSPPLGIWTEVFYVLHKDELKNDNNPAIPGQVQSTPDPSAAMDSIAGGFLPKNWVIKGGEFFATLDWNIKSQEVPGGTVTEKGSFKLYHRPQ